ncbi:hypothetical protein TgHK011_007603 [Trichoderma gracile]|nr:hypothetical protein TgHK011_007603 [Trichoderma gracile]
MRGGETCGTRWVYRVVTAAGDAGRRNKCSRVGAAPWGPATGCLGSPACGAVSGWTLHHGGYSERRSEAQRRHKRPETKSAREAIAGLWLGGGGRFKRRPLL